MKTREYLFNRQAIHKAERELRSLNPRYVVGHSFTTSRGFVLELRIFTTGIGSNNDDILSNCPKEYGGFPIHLEEIREAEFL